jgi:hypothetical protein
MHLRILSILLLTTLLALAQTPGHQHDTERELMIRSLFALSWPVTTGLQSNAILTATSPASLLLWADGSAIIIDASELVAAGLNLSKRSPAGYLFDPESDQIVITSSDLRTIDRNFRYKDAIFADFMMSNDSSVHYNPNLGRVSISSGEGYASWLINVMPSSPLPSPTVARVHPADEHAEHDDQLHEDHDLHADHDHDHEHDSDLLDGHDHHLEEESDFLLGRQFWSASAPLRPGQVQRLGQAQPTFHFQIIINAKPLRKNGLKPHLLHSMRYEIERYGFLHLFSHERIIIDYYL